MSRKLQSKARSVDDVDSKLENAEESEPKVVSSINMDMNDIFIQKLAGRHLELIANRTKSIQKRMTKTRSTFLIMTGFINIEIGPQSFIKENAGKFSDYYKIITRIGQGGYGQVFKVQNRNSGLLRAMKSRLSG